MNLFLLARMVLRQQAIRSRICHTIDVTHEFQSIECSIFNLVFFFFLNFGWNMLIWKELKTDRAE